MGASLSTQFRHEVDRALGACARGFAEGYGEGCARRRVAFMVLAHAAAGALQVAPSPDGKAWALTFEPDGSPAALRRQLLVVQERLSVREVWDMEEHMQRQLARLLARCMEDPAQHNEGGVPKGRNRLVEAGGTRMATLRRVTTHAAFLATQSLLESAAPLGGASPPPSPPLRSAAAASAAASSAAASSPPDSPTSSALSSPPDSPCGGVGGGGEGGDEWGEAFWRCDDASGRFAAGNTTLVVGTNWLTGEPTVKPFAEVRFDGAPSAQRHKAVRLANWLFAHAAQSRGAAQLRQNLLDGSLLATYVSAADGKLADRAQRRMKSLVLGTTCPLIRRREILRDLVPYMLHHFP
jgi:hypothetical protein